MKAWWLELEFVLSGLQDTRVWILDPDCMYIVASS